MDLPEDILSEKYEEAQDFYDSANTVDEFQNLATEKNILNSQVTLTSIMQDRITELPKMMLK